MQVFEHELAAMRKMLVINKADVTAMRVTADALLKERDVCLWKCYSFVWLAIMRSVRSRYYMKFCGMT